MQSEANAQQLAWLKHLSKRTYTLGQRQSVSKAIEWLAGRPGLCLQPHELEKLKGLETHFNIRTKRFQDRHKNEKRT